MSDPKHGGMTDAEKRCMERLMESYGEWLEMERLHPDEVRDFVDAVHKIQGLIGMRVLHRHHPEFWMPQDEGKEQPHE